MVKALSSAAIAMLMSCSAALAADAKSAPFKVDILIVESHGAIASWVQSPPSKRQGDYGRLRTVKIGTKTYFPIVVTGFDLAGRPSFSADFEIVSPSGKSETFKKCCGANVFDPKTPGLVVLNPVVDLTFDAEEPSGTYTVRATVNDGPRSASASERFRLGASADAKKPPARQGGAESAPARLEPAQGCVIKPVMTDEEIKRCR